MTSKEAEEIKEEMRRIEKKRQDQIDTIKAWAIGIAILLFLVWAYHRGSTGVNAPSPNDPTCQVTNDSEGMCN